jgi:hypothetical protein
MDCCVLYDVDVVNYQKHDRKRCLLPPHHSRVKPKIGHSTVYSLYFMVDRFTENEVAYLLKIQKRKLQVTLVAKKDARYCKYTLLR